MGKRRQLRKRVNSELSLNCGVSSDSESELSVVDSQPVTGQTSSHNDKVDTDRSASAFTNGMNENYACPGSQNVSRQGDSTLTDSVSCREQADSQGSFRLEVGQHISIPSGEGLQSFSTSAHTSNPYRSSQEHSINASTSSGHFMHQQTLHPRDGKHAEFDTCLQSAAATTGRFDTNHASHARYVGANRTQDSVTAQTHSHRESMQFVQSGADLPVIMTISGENSETGNAVQANPVGASSSRGQFISQTNLYDVNTSHTQANTGLQSNLEFAGNSDTEHRPTAQANSYRFAPLTASSVARGNVCGAAISFAQTDLGHRYTATSLLNPQVGNARVGSGDRLILEGTGDSIRNTLAEFCHQIRQQNEAQNRTLTDCLMGTSTMLKECLAGVSNVVRENSVSVSECVKGMSSQLSDLAAQNKTQLSNLHDTVNSLRTDAYRPPLFSRDVTREQTSNPWSNAVVSHTPFESATRCTVASNSLRTNQNSFFAGNSFITRAGRSAHDITEHNHSFLGTQGNVTGMHASNPLTCVGRAMQNSHATLTPNSYNLQDGTLETRTSTLEPVARSASMNPQTVLYPGHFSSQNTNNAANTHNSRETRNRGVKLPAFTGNSSDSWKVWFARFMTVANLNNWDESTRLSELVQRLQGTAAEFVFDEIPSEIISNFSNLVHELSLRFQTVETNKTFRVQFSKRVQRLGESVEDYSAELKRLYDKAYPGRNPEMRRQLLLQQFLGGLRDHEAKFAVEYFKEPGSIEDAVHNVVTYMEAQQGNGYKRDQSNGFHSKTVRFYGSANGQDSDDDESSDSDGIEKSAHISRSMSPSNAQRDRQTVRKIINKLPNPESKSTCPVVADSLSQKEIAFIHRLVSSAEQSSNVPTPTKTHVAPRGQGQISQGHIRSQSQGQGQLTGPNRFANTQCYHCLNYGHIKRDCLVWKAEQGSNKGREPQRREHQPLPRLPIGQGHPPNIALN